MNSSGMNSDNSDDMRSGDGYTFKDRDACDMYKRMQLAIIERMQTDGVLGGDEARDQLRRYLLVLLSHASTSVRYTTQTREGWIFWRGRWVTLAVFAQLASQDGASDQERDHGAFGKGWKW